MRSDEETETPFHEAVLPVTASDFEPPCAMSPVRRSLTLSPLAAHDVPVPSNPSEIPVPVPEGAVPLISGCSGVLGVVFPESFTPSPNVRMCLFTVALPLD